jgi:hypothetical protein
VPSSTAAKEEGSGPARVTAPKAATFAVGRHRSVESASAAASSEYSQAREA